MNKKDIYIKQVNEECTDLARKVTCVHDRARGQCNTSNYLVSLVGVPKLQNIGKNQNNVVCGFQTLLLQQNSSITLTLP